MSMPGAGEQRWPELSAVERRVLGVMIEKAKTTPDAYPMSVNGLVTGCNQKSNRDPVMSLEQDEVEATLADLQGKRLVTKIIGGRVERWKHNLYEAWGVEKVDLAVLGELLLRGAQTEGELRGRASRMEPIEELTQLRGLLRPLAERGLVVFLGEEGRRGTLIAPGFQSQGELDRLHAQARESESSPAAPVQRGGEVDGLREELSSLRAELTQLQSALGQLQQQVQGLKDALGS